MPHITDFVCLAVFEMYSNLNVIYPSQLAATLFATLPDLSNDHQKQITPTTPDHK